MQQQARLIASARHVAGFDGSAFYSALLADKVHGLFHIFGRRNYISHTLSFMLAAKGIALEKHVFQVEHLYGEEALARFIMPEPEKIIEALVGY